VDKLPFDPYDFFGYISSGVLVLLAMNAVLGFPDLHSHSLTAFDTACLILFVYIAGQIVAGPAKTILEDVFVCSVLGRPAYNLLRQDKSVGRFLFPRYFKPFSESKRKVLAAQLGPVTKGSSDDIFIRVRYSPEVLAQDRLLGRLDSFRDKYGFNRNLAFTSFIVGLSLLVKHLMVHDAFTIHWGLTAIVGSVFLFYRYLKFFRQYSYELFNAYRGTVQPS